MEALNRLPDWAKRYHDYVDGVKNNVFDWAENNCAFFAAGAVEAMTGKNLAYGFKSAKTSKALISLLNKKGYADLEELALDKLPKIHISRAKVGDVAVFRTDDLFGVSLGIVNGETILVMSEKGMGLRPLFDAEYALEV